MSKLEEDYQKSLELLQKQRDDVKQLTEILSLKDRSIAEMEKKEVTYQHCMRKIQVHYMVFIKIFSNRFIFIKLDSNILARIREIFS